MTIALLGHSDALPGVQGNFSGASGPYSLPMFMVSNAPAGSCVVLAVFYVYTTIYPSMTVSSVVDSVNGITFSGLGKVQSTTANPTNPSYAGYYIACEFWVGFGPIDATQTHYVVNITMSNPCRSLVGSYAVFGGVTSATPVDPNPSMPAGSSTAGVSAAPSLSGLNTSLSDDYLLALVGTPWETDQTAVTLNGTAAAFNCETHRPDYPTLKTIISQLWGFPLSGPQSGMALAGNAADYDVMMLALALTGNTRPPTRSFGGIIG